MRLHRTEAAGEVLDGLRNYRGVCVVLGISLFYPNLPGTYYICY